MCDLPLHEEVTSLVGNRRHVCCVFFVVFLLCLCDFQVFFVRSLRMIAGTKDAHLKMPLRIWLMRRFAYRIIGSVLFEAPLQTLVEFRASREAYEGHRVVPLWIRAFFHLHSMERPERRAEEIAASYDVVDGPNDEGEPRCRDSSGRSLEVPKGLTAIAKWTECKVLRKQTPKPTSQLCANVRTCKNRLLSILDISQSHMRRGCSSCFHWTV